MLLYLSLKPYRSLTPRSSETLTFCYSLIINETLP